MQRTRYLALENGRIFQGFAFGAEPRGDGAMGEVVFTTNMAGFTETVTDPAYEGQIVVQTFPLVGNCGVDPADIESLGKKPHIKGYAVKERCDMPSHFGCEETLDAFLERHGIPGIWGIDTRALTKLIRSEGTLRGVIRDDLNHVDFDKLKAFTITDAAQRVGIDAPALFSAVKSNGRKVLLWDFGVRNSSIQWLTGRGFDVKVVPFTWTAEQLLAGKADALLLSDGPGNPLDCSDIIDEITKLLAAGVKIFAFGLGHQLLALANGGATQALPYGHRGGYPVKDLVTGRTFITGQNHGYIVSEIPAGAAARYVNGNDSTCEGLDYANGNFSVQFKPENCGNTRDTEALFERLAVLIDRGNASCH